MNIADVMDELAAVLDTVSGLRVFAWPPGTVTPPAAVVGYPDGITFDQTYGRGSDQVVVPIVVVVGKASDRTARDRLGAYADGSGPSSIKDVIESGTYTEFDTVRVTTADFDTMTIGGTDYLAAIFYCEIFGKGSV